MENLKSNKYHQSIDIAFLEKFRNLYGSDFLDEVQRLRQLMASERQSAQYCRLANQIQGKVRALKSDELKGYTLHLASFRRNIQINQFVSSVLIATPQRSELNKVRLRFLPQIKNPEQLDLADLKQFLGIYCSLYKKQQMQVDSQLDIRELKRVLTSFKKNLSVDKQCRQQPDAYYINKLFHIAFRKARTEVIKKCNRRQALRLRQLRINWFGPKLWQTICEMDLIWELKQSFMQRILEISKQEIQDYQHKDRIDPATFIKVHYKLCKAFKKTHLDLKIVAPVIAPPRNWGEIRPEQRTRQAIQQERQLLQQERLERPYISVILFPAK